LSQVRRRDNGSFVVADAVFGDRLLDRVQQISIANGFGQELNRAGLSGPNRHRHIGMAADEDNRQAQISLGQLLLKIEPASLGQPDFESQAPQGSPGARN
jgi:hypothetical protein